VASTVGFGNYDRRPDR